MNFLTVQSKVLFSISLFSLTCSSELFRCEGMDIASCPKVVCVSETGLQCPLWTYTMYHKPLEGSFFTWSFQCNVLSPVVPLPLHIHLLSQLLAELQTGSGPAAWRDESGIFVRSLVPSFPLFPFMHEGALLPEQLQLAAWVPVWADSTDLCSMTLLTAYPVPVQGWSELGAALVGWGKCCRQCRCGWVWLSSCVGAEIQSLFCHRLPWQP